MLYIFDKDDNFKNIITEDTGLIDTRFKDYQNHLIDEPFVFHVDSESELLPLIVAENQVAFKHTFNALQQDVEMLKLMRIKEIDEIYNSDGYIVRVQCEPSWLELYDHFIEDRRVENGTAQTALNRALQGSRWVGLVAGEFGNGSTNFYWIDAVEALFKTAEEWGGTLQDYITLDENNEIATRIMYLLPRLGRDNGLLIQPGYNAETIERRTLSYPVTAIWGQGASLEIEDDEGQHTGGYTRYITFEDVEWKKSKGDPVDKPKGQKWVGDPDALAKYGYLKDDGSRMHRFGHFSNQDYETPEELLHATWEALQKEKEPEVYHEAVIDEVDKPIFLGDTGTILDRHYGKPIEVQSQITGLEYDILRPTENVNIVLGNYKDMSRDPLEDEIDEIKKEQSRPPIINDNSFPDVKPGTPVNVEAVGMFRAILVSWEYDSKIYMSHYEVYASQTADFVPDAQFLVYRGRVSSFGHEVGSNETWYYRVRAVNTHGTTSDFSVEVSASSTRIDFIDLEDEIKQEIQDTKDRAEEAYGNANIATQNAMDAIDKAQQGFDAAQQAITSAGTANTKADQSLSQAQSAFDKAQESLDEIGNLSIGGRNLLLDSGTPIKSDKYELIRYTLSKPIKAGTMVTILLKAKLGEGKTHFIFYNSRGNTERHIGSIFRVGEVGEYALYKGTFEWKIGRDGRNESLVVFHASVNTVVESEILWAKLVEGNTTTTDYMEAPEDVDQKIKVVADDLNGLSVTVNNNKSDITSIQATAQGLQTQVTNNKNDLTSVTQLAKGTQQTVSNLQGDFTQVSTTVDGLQIEVGKKVDNTTYNSKMTQLDNAISQRVTKTDANNLYTQKTEFNQFADGFEQRVESLEGDVTTGFSAITQTVDSIDKRVQDAEGNVGALQTTATSLAGRLTDAEGNLTTLTSTVQGIQTSVSNVQGDLSQVTQLANAHQTKISNMEGDITTLTQTATSLTARIDNIGNRNYLKNSDFSDDMSGWLRTIQSYINYNVRDVSTDFRQAMTPNAQELRIEKSAGEAYLFQDLQSIPKGTEKITVSFYVYQSISASGYIRAYLKINDDVFVGSSTQVTTTKGRLIRFTHTYDVSNHDIDEVRLQLNLSDYVGTLWIQAVSLVTGDVPLDWSPSPDDAYSQYSQLQNAINLRVQKGDVINQINLDTSGVLISGKKLVLDGDTTVTGNFRVRDANIASIEAGKITGGTADFAKFSAINIKAGSISSGTLDAEKVMVRGGSNTDYAQIDGSEITTRGQHVRTWFGETKTHDVGLQLRYGRLRFHNYDSKRNLYFSDFGISTYYGGSDGEGGGNQGSGTIEFFSYRHNSTIRGLTMYSNNGVVALESEQRNIVIAPRYSTYSGGSKFSFDVKSTGDGYVTFGNSGIRIQRDGNSVIYATNGNGDLASGSFYAQSLYGDLKPRGSYAYVRAPRLRIIDHDSATTSNFGDLEGQQFMAGSIRLNLQLGNDNFYIGTSSGEVRITNNLLWQGSHSDTTYRPIRARSFIESSSRTFKTDIKAYEDSAMDVIRSLTVVNYRFKDDVERGVNLQQIGFISEDSPAIATADNMAIQTTKLASYLTKGVQELDLKVDLTREELVLKIAKLEQRINKLESAA